MERRCNFLKKKLFIEICRHIVTTPRSEVDGDASFAKFQRRILKNYTYDAATF